MTIYTSMRTYDCYISSLSACIRHDKLRYTHEYASPACRLKTVHLSLRVMLLFGLSMAIRLKSVMLLFGLSVDTID
jgi:hypothetical protein